MSWVDFRRLEIGAGEGNNTKAFNPSNINENKCYMNCSIHIPIHTQRSLSNY